MKSIGRSAVPLAALLLGCAAAQTPAQPGAAVPAKDEKCSVEGRVLNASGDPLKKVALTLAVSGSPLGATKTESDEKGAFAFHDLEPGRYTLVGEKAGFARQAYGARSNPNTGSALILSKGQQMKDVVFKLIPAAVISGKVLDEDGEPVANAVVLALKTLYQSGEATLAPLGSAATNDAGEFRIGSLSAGSYILAATNRMVLSGLSGSSNKPAGEGPERDYVTTYYPNSLDQAGAASIQVTAGAEAGGANIRLAKTDTVRVRGKVSGGVEGKQVMVMLAPKTLAPTKSAAGSVSQLTGGRSAIANANRTFEIVGVTPGAYGLTAISEDLSGGGGFLFASQEIQVGKEHVDGVGMAFAAAGELSGVVVVEGQKPVDFKGVQVALEAAPGFVSLTTPRGPVGEGGKFTLKAVTPARYRAQVTGAPEDSYVKSVKLGNQEAADDAFEAGGGATAALQISLSLTGAQVDGVVRGDDDKPKADVTVVLIPDSKRASLYREARTDRNGSFTFKGVPPGGYRALAWEDVESAAYKDPEYLKTVEGKAEALTLNESDRKTTSLQVIPWRQ